MATFKQNTAHANGQLSTLEKASEGFGQRDETVLGVPPMETLLLPVMLLAQSIGERLTIMALQ
jgi:hypothetical protein